MFENILNGIRNGQEAANAARIVEEITGLPASESIISSLQRRSQMCYQSRIRMNKYEYAFEELFYQYVNLDNSFINIPERNGINKDDPLRLKIIDMFKAHVLLGNITNSVLIKLFETENSKEAFDYTKPKKLDGKILNMNENKFHNPSINVSGNISKYAANFSLNKEIKKLK